jgi:hypothetical protein
MACSLGRAFACGTRPAAAGGRQCAPRRRAVAACAQPGVATVPQAAKKNSQPDVGTIPFVFGAPLPLADATCAGPPLPALQPDARRAPEAERVGASPARAKVADAPEGPSSAKRTKRRAEGHACAATAAATAAAEALPPPLPESAAMEAAVAPALEAAPVKPKAAPATAAPAKSRQTDAAQAKTGKAAGRPAQPAAPPPCAACGAAPCRCGEALAHATQARRTAELAQARNAAAPPAPDAQPLMLHDARGDIVHCSACRQPLAADAPRRVFLCSHGCHMTMHGGACVGTYTRLLGNAGRRWRFGMPCLTHVASPGACAGHGVRAHAVDAAGAVTVYFEPSPPATPRKAAALPAAPAVKPPSPQQQKQRSAGAAVALSPPASPPRAPARTAEESAALLARSAPVQVILPRAADAAAPKGRKAAARSQPPMAPLLGSLGSDAQQEHEYGFSYESYDSSYGSYGSYDFYGACMYGASCYYGSEAGDSAGCSEEHSSEDGSSGGALLALEAAAFPTLRESTAPLPRAHAAAAALTPAAAEAALARCVALTDVAPTAMLLLWQRDGTPLRLGGGGSADDICAAVAALCGAAPLRCALLAHRRAAALQLPTAAAAATAHLLVPSSGRVAAAFLTAWPPADEAQAPAFNPHAPAFVPAGATEPCSAPQLHWACFNDEWTRAYHAATAFDASAAPAPPALRADAPAFAPAAVEQEQEQEQAHLREVAAQISTDAAMAMALQAQEAIAAPGPSFLAVLARGAPAEEQRCVLADVPPLEAAAWCFSPAGAGLRAAPTRGSWARPLAGTLAAALQQTA